MIEARSASCGLGEITVTKIRRRRLAWTGNHRQDRHLSPNNSTSKTGPRLVLFEQSFQSSSSFLLFCFLQAISAVELWSVYSQKVPELLFVLLLRLHASDGERKNVSLLYIDLRQASQNPQCYLVKINTADS